MLQNTLYTFCVIKENCVSFEKHQIRIVSKTQILNNLTSAERSGAQCEVERHCGDMFSKSAKTQIEYAFLAE